MKSKKIAAKTEYVVNLPGRGWWNGTDFGGVVREHALPVMGELIPQVKQEAGKQADELNIEPHTPLLPNAGQAANAVEQTHAIKLQELGRKIIDTLVRSGTETMALCAYIRANSVSPKLVSAELCGLGFSRSWASKVNKVAQCADEVWDAFQARTFTFKDVLQLGQGQAVESLAAEMGADVVDVKAQVEELEKEEEESPELIEETESEKKEKRKKQNERAFATLVKNFGQEKVFRKINLKVGGFQFVVTKVKVAKQSPGTSPEKA